MISDTIAQADMEIRRYLDECPEAYEDIRPEIETMLAVMEAVRLYLDTDPPTDTYARAAKLQLQDNMMRIRTVLE